MRPFLAAVVALWMSSPGFARPILWYTMDRGPAVIDIGTAPQANGTLTGAAAILANQTPNSLSCASLDLTPNGAANNALSAGDAAKLDALPAMTATLWINLRAAPAAGDCLLSDMPAGVPPANQGGWELRIAPPSAGTISAGSFRLQFNVMRVSGDAITQTTYSPDIDADHKWVFVAVTYTSSRVLTYWIGTENTSVAPIGGQFGYSFNLPNNNAEFRIGAAGSEPGVDRTPPAWIDDVRIYDTDLSSSQLEEVRLSNVIHSIPSGAPAFFALPDLPGGACYSVAGSISADGSTVVGGSISTNGYEAYRWKDGVLTGLGDLPGGAFQSEARDVNDDGSVVIGIGRSMISINEGWRWEAGVMTPLGDLPGGDYFCLPGGIRGDGSIVVGVSIVTGDFANGFIWEAGVMQGLGFLPGAEHSIAWDISSDGTVIVGTSGTSAEPQAFRHENGVMTPLGDPPGGAVNSAAYRISPNGQVIVGEGATAAGMEAVIWRNGRIITLGDLPGGAVQARATAVTRNGSRVVGYSQTGVSTSDAFIWDRYDGMRKLSEVLALDYGQDMSWWHLDQALGISDDGTRIVGYGDHPAGYRVSWVAQLPPLAGPADFDADGDVDSDDFNLFQSCATREAVPYDPGNLPSGCEMKVDLLGLIQADLDWDGDIDLNDFAEFQRCVAGPNVLPPPECRG